MATFDAAEKAALPCSILAPAECFGRRSMLLTTALKRAEGALGGEVFEGRALDKQGRVQQGKVAVIGPVAMFADASGQTSGLLQQELNKTDPTVADVDKTIADASCTRRPAARATWPSIPRSATPSSSGARGKPLREDRRGRLGHGAAAAHRLRHADCGLLQVHPALTRAAGHGEGLADRAALRGAAAE